MAVVKSVTIHSDRPWANGLRKRRYAVTVTDNDGVDHTRILMPVKVNVSDDGTAIANEVLDAITAREVDRFISQTRESILVDVTTGKFNTAKVLFKAIARAAFLADREDDLRFGFLPLLATATDTQLRNLFDRNQAFVDNVRAKAAKLQAIKDAEDLYTPEDIE